MLKSYIRTALRNLRKYRSHALINVLGLALGIGGSLVLLLYLQHQTSFDQHWSDHEQVFLVSNTTMTKGERRYGPGTPRTVPPIIAEGYADVETVSLLVNDQMGLLTLEKDGQETSHFVDYGFMGIDSAFGELFQLSYLAGSWEAFLSTNQGILLSRNQAESIFGSVGDALGADLTMDQTYLVTVVGVFEDQPETTEFPFNALFNRTLRGEGDVRWGSIASNDMTMVKLRAGADVAAFKAYLWEMPTQKMEENVRDLRLQATAVADLHYNTLIGGIYAPAVSKGQLWGLGAIALILILTACINFVNLSTALASKRAREIGVRKVLGSHRYQLVMQFLTETLVITLVAVLLALGLAELVLMNLDENLGVELRISDLPTWELALWGIGILFAVTLLAGIYPALAMTRFRPLQALKETHLRLPGGGMNLRRSLVVLQFAISQVMIMATIIVVVQVNYAKSKDMGYSADHLVAVHLPETNDGNAERMRDRVLTQPAIVGASLSQQEAASYSSWRTYMKHEGEQIEMGVLIWDEYYQSMHQIELLAGNSLVPEDSVTQVLINRRMADELGFANPDEAVGSTIPLRYFGTREPLHIRGVVENFHLSSIHEAIPNVVIAYQPVNYRVLSMRVQDEDLEAAMASVGEVYGDLYPGSVFDFSRAEETMGYFYEAETRLSQLFQLFALLAIAIGCLGLYGLANFVVTTRQKEIGVRKVLGASIGHILWLFSQEYIRLILFGFVLAVPIAAYFMRGWLQEFAYSISLSWWLFALGLVFAALVAILTVGYRSLLAARSNPVNSLKYE